MEYGEGWYSSEPEVGDGSTDDSGQSGKFEVSIVWKELGDGRYIGKKPYVFRQNLVQSLIKQRPVEDLQVFFDVPRFRIRKLHDALEKIFKPWLVL